MNPQAVVDHLSEQIRQLSVELAIVKAERDELRNAATTPEPAEGNQ